jgi:hypothetical protein
MKTGKSMSSLVSSRGRAGTHKKTLFTHSKFLFRGSSIHEQARGGRELSTQDKVAVWSLLINMAIPVVTAMRHFYIVCQLVTTVLSLLGWPTALAAWKFPPPLNPIAIHCMDWCQGWARCLML